jgi:hypothetical protein
MAVDIRALEGEPSDAALEFFRRLFRCLDRQRGKACEAGGMPLDRVGQKVVRVAGAGNGLVRFRLLHTRRV